MLRDTQARKIHSFPLDLNAGEEVLLGPFVVTPEDGAVLTREPLAEIDFYVRETGSGDPFVDLTTGVDLSGYQSGVNVSFDLKAVASPDLVGRFRGTVWLGILYRQVSAGWYERDYLTANGDRLLVNGDYLII